MIYKIYQELISFIKKFYFLNQILMFGHHLKQQFDIQRINLKYMNLIKRSGFRFKTFFFNLKILLDLNTITVYSLISLN